MRPPAGWGREVAEARIASGGFSLFRRIAGREIESSGK
jgi:hypothetical protein